MIENIALGIFFFFAACSAIDLVVGLALMGIDDIKAQYKEMLEETRG